MALACLLVVPGTAHAAVLVGPSGMEGDLYYTADAGERNVVDVAVRQLAAGPSGYPLHEVVIHDRGAVIRSTTDLCRVVHDHRAICVVDAEVPTFHLGDGADHLRRLSSPADPPVAADGGTGDDRLLGLAGSTDWFWGGPGDDELRGELGTASLAPLQSLPTDRLHGDDGDDYLRGGPGEAILVGGLGADSVIGDDQHDIIVGGDEDDDVLDGADNLQGGGGHDLVLGGAGADRIRGGNGNDRLLGEHECGDMNPCNDLGRDRIEPGDGIDFVRASEGGVHALTRDAFRDTVLCVGGDDRVDADPLDETSRDCDTVFVGLPPLVGWPAGRGG